MLKGTGEEWQDWNGCRVEGADAHLTTSVLSGKGALRKEQQLTWPTTSQGSAGKESQSCPGSYLEQPPSGPLCQLRASPWCLLYGALMANSSTSDLNSSAVLHSGLLTCIGEMLPCVSLTTSYLHADQAFIYSMEFTTKFVSSLSMQPVWTLHEVWTLSPVCHPVLEARSRGRDCWWLDFCWNKEEIRIWLKINDLYFRI